MIAVKRAAVVGLGLIGGSVARDLAALGIAVSGHDDDDRALDDARQAGVIDRPLDRSFAGLEDAEVVVIAVPVDEAPDVLARIARRAGKVALITDAGSTKSRIVAAASELGLGERFVGSHPLAGSHRSGWQASRTGLFADARVFLCPTGTATPATIRLATELWRALGGRPIVIGAVEHDQRLAWTSHMPQLVSSSLGLALARAGIVRDELGTGGLDMTRLAGGSPDMWIGIATENAPAIDEALAGVQRELTALRASLSRRDAGALRKRFVAARRWFEDRQADR